jgi:hypothetical protein
MGYTEDLEHIGLRSFATLRFRLRAPGALTAQDISTLAQRSAAQKTPYF